MSEDELQHKLIYSMIVAGKPATFTEAVLTRFYWNRNGMSPFALISFYSLSGVLEEKLRACRSGNYTKLARGFKELVSADLDLHTCGVVDLEKIHGIGKKTSRFFLMWTRPGSEFAALDVHVLRWLRSLGHDAPKSTPSNPATYAAFESIFLKEAKKRGMTARELDSAIWDFGSQNRGTEYPKELQPIRF